jgi:hypothetical protein
MTTILADMLEASYLALLIGVFLIIGALSVFVVYKLFAGQR